MRENMFHPLTPFFKPQNVALIGASDKVDSVGRTLLLNLLDKSFQGKIFPVNLSRKEILGQRTFSKIADIPYPIDLAVIATPASGVPSLIEECLQANVKSVIIISAGFKEIGPKGIQLESEILQILKKGTLRVIGPNCLGVMNPLNSLNATFAEAMAKPGNVAFISQSGALCTSILDWSLQENVGFSAFISIGSMLDIDWGDLIEYLGEDPDTHSIVIYMESIGNAHSFLKAAKKVSPKKPIIVLKAGRTQAAAKAAASHTGSITGSDEVLDAAFRRVGVLRVKRIAELFYMTEVLAKQPLPKGPRLTIVTNAGGPGVLATDSLISEGGKLSELSEDILKELDETLPAAWSHHNPIDILGDADPERYSRALQIAAKDTKSDGLLVILTPQAMTEPSDTARQLIPYAKKTDKPVLASWMGGKDVAEGNALLNAAEISTFLYPDTAAQVFHYMWQYSENLQSLQETLSCCGQGVSEKTDPKKVSCQIQAIRKTGRLLLTEVESKEVLKAYQIPTNETRIAHNETEAAQIAEEIGFPVVLKIYSETITHKTDIGGVKLNLNTPEEVRTAFQEIKTSVSEKAKAGDFLGVTVQAMIQKEAYELILGASPDPQFGPVMLFGMGGQLVEIFRDHALGLPPLSPNLARRMMEQTKIYKGLQGVRGRKAVDLEKLECLLVNFSQMIIDQPLIKEIDINPLLVSSDLILAVDARIVLYDQNISEKELSKYQGVFFRGD
ncbi:MAG: acetate--CoA ligase family protein [Deltaproteobacteria bacterium]|nr:acetate--CoA ligase family protein [Deltaproteobacteria bacterium]